ncbi:MAG: PAS domain S-box protein [Devosia sp.]|nr:PAS domain S-box protein [Devosia sp.]
MRSLGLFGVSTGIASAASGGDRPEMLRRKTIANNAYLLIAASVLGMPVAMWFLVSQLALPFVIACAGLVGGMVSLSLHHRRRHEEAALAQVITFLGTGLVLTALDSRLGDSGLALALMGPVLAALLTSRPIRRLSWMATGLILVVGALDACLGLPSGLAFADPAMATSACAFAVAIAVLVHTTHHINAGYVVHDKAQLNAYRHLIEHVQDGVLRYSGEGELLSASRSSETLFGCPRYQITASALVERLHVLDRPLYLTALADANHGGKSRTIEVRMRRDQDTGTSNLPHFIWVEIRFSPIIEADAARHEVIAMLRDVTERKDAEAATEQARHLAEEASQAKSRFLATMGHELRTPLNAVVGFSEMMTSGIGGELSPTHKEYAGLIQQSGRHLLDVVGMLLDMSRIEAGKFEIDASRFQPDEIVPACLSMVETMAQAKTVTLATEIEPDLPAIVADERACRQILLNLLSNAVKFSHHGGGVTLVVKRQGQSISFAVRDRGIGMGPLALERIGEPFFQAQDGLTRHYEGTGLGLSIVKGLVDLHGGALRAISEVGLGTTMTVLLPINGPATKMAETANVLPLHREPPVAPKTSWQNEKRKAQ